MSTIRVVLHDGTPASTAKGAGYYSYKGDKPCVKPPPAESLPQNAEAMRSRKERLAEYVRLRTVEKLTPEEAAPRVRTFGRTTRRTYEKHFEELQEQQRRESPS